MREILFKAKRVDNGEWVEGDVGFNNKGCARIWERTDVLTLGDLVDKNTVCQYTGLRDKNGDRIFEGDFLRYNGSARGLNWSIEHATSSDSAAVEFSYEYAGGWVISAVGHSLNIGTRSDKFEITGNIHDGGDND